MKLLHTLLLSAALLMTSQPAFAADYSVAAAGDASISPELGGHGIVIVDGATSLGNRGARARATLNTDTLTLAVENLALDPETSLRVGIAGEALISGLLTDYYRAGEKLPEYGFYASWVTAFQEMKRRIASRHFLHWRVDSKVWFFNPTPDTTSPNVLLPDPFFVLEQSIGYTYWNFRDDRSLNEPHHWFRRLHGFAFGTSADLHLRSQASRWVTGDVRRNDPERTISIFRQWAAAGHPLGYNVRFQIEQEARVGFGEDDITRRRIGGFTPYAVRLAGAPWPAFLSSRTLSVHPSLHWNAFGDSEVGVLADVVALSDPGRVGAEQEHGVLGGTGLFFDYRRGPWQGDLRAGVLLPSRWMDRQPRIGLFVGLGRSF